MLHVNNNLFENLLFPASKTKLKFLKKEEKKKKSERIEPWSTSL